MPALADIGQERQRISERLTQLDAERSRLAEELAELETAERVLARFGSGAAAGPVERRRRGRPPGSGAAKKAAPRARPPAAREQGLSMSEAALKAIGAHPEGITANELLGYLAREYGLAVRPNHLGITLQRHRRAGRAEIRDSRWFPPAEARDLPPC